MNIIFSHLGFHSADVFIANISDKYPGQYHIGFITERLDDNFDFDYFGIYLDKFKNIIPTPEQIIEEYKRQFASKGVCINPDGVVYAG
jgi:hypothetical protein